jgi:hypothetical protein
MDKKLGSLKILKETEEKFVKLDVEMDDVLITSLVDYTIANSSAEELRNIFINWAFNDILKKQLQRRTK